MMRGVSPWFTYFLWPNGQDLLRVEADALGQAPIKPVSVMQKVKRNFEHVCRYIAHLGPLRVPLTDPPGDRLAEIASLVDPRVAGL